jgi:hypothetical protein
MLQRKELMGQGCSGGWGWGVVWLLTGGALNHEEELNRCALNFGV